jgi:hypothetical protein
MVLVSCIAVPINRAGTRNHTPRDIRAGGIGRLSLLPALEVAPTERRPQIETKLRGDPADEHGESALGRATHSPNSRLRSRSRASLSTWSNGGGRPARDCGPSCTTTRQTSPPWICSLFQLSVSTYFMPFIVRLRPQRPDLDQRHSTSDGRMGCTSDNRGVSLGRCSGLHDPRPRSDLRHRRWISALGTNSPADRGSGPQLSTTATLLGIPRPTKLLQKCGLRSKAASRRRTATWSRHRAVSTWIATLSLARSKILRNVDML